MWKIKTIYYTLDDGKIVEERHEVMWSRQKETARMYANWKRRDPAVGKVKVWYKEEN